MLLLIFFCMASQFRSIIVFLEGLGLFDVILPFILIFAIVFAILEKSKVFGVEKIDDKEYTRKNINAMVGFVVAFIFVASAQAVSIINKAIANISILIVAGVMFLILIGMFFSEDEDMFLELGWTRWVLIVVMFIGVILMFLNAVTNAAGQTWLQVFWDYVAGTSVDDSVFGSIILIILIALFIGWITKSESKPPKPSKSENKE